MVMRCLIIAGRDNGSTAKACRKLALVSAEAYRTAMRGFAEQTFLDVWYAHLDIGPALAEVKAQIKAKRMKMFQKALAKAHTKDSTSALAKLTAEVDGQRRIISDPPTIVPVKDLFPNVEAAAIYSRSALWSASTGAACSPTGDTCSASSPCCTWRGRSSGWAASAPAPGSR